VCHCQGGTVGTVRDEVDGFVLAGGRSERFGADKFLHVVDGTSMGQRAIDALSGLRSVTVVGPPRGDVDGATWWMGAREGEGPLGAIVDVLERVDGGHAVILGCDTPAVNAEVVDRLLQALAPNVDVAVATEQRSHWLVAAWSAERSFHVFRTAWINGERSIQRAARGLTIEAVRINAELLRNVNRREDVDV